MKFHHNSVKLWIIHPAIRPSSFLPPAYLCTQLSIPANLGASLQKLGYVQRVGDTCKAGQDTWVAGPSGWMLAFQRLPSMVAYQSAAYVREEGPYEVTDGNSLFDGTE